MIGAYSIQMITGMHQVMTLLTTISLSWEGLFGQSLTTCPQCLVGQVTTTGITHGIVLGDIVPIMGLVLGGITGATVAIGILGIHTAIGGITHMPIGIHLGEVMAMAGDMTTVIGVVIIMGTMLTQGTIIMDVVLQAVL